VSANERLVLFPTWLLLDLLGVVMLSIFGYEQVFFIKVDDNFLGECVILGYSPSLRSVTFHQHEVIYRRPVLASEKRAYSSVDTACPG